MRFLFLFFFLFSNLALAKDPLSEGFLFLEKKDYNRAFSTFSTIKKKKPFIYTAMGISKALSGDYEKALDFLFIATEDTKESKNWVPNFFIGFSFYNLNKYKDAIPFLEKSYSLNQDNETLTLLGKSYFKIENYKKSEEILDKIYKEKKDEEISLLLAKSKISLNKNTEAENLLNESITLYPQNPFLLYERAKLRFKNGQIDLAEKDIEIAISLSNNPEIQKIYSSIKLAKKSEQKVIKVKKTLNIEYFFYLIISSLLLFLGLILFLKKKEVSVKEKLLFAKTLLEKADYISAINIFSELKKQKKYRDSSVKGLLISKILLGKEDDALSEAEQIQSEPDKFFYFALIYLYFDDKTNFNKYLDLLDQLGNKEKVTLLKKFLYSDKNTVISFLIKEVQ